MHTNAISSTHENTNTAHVNVNVNVNVNVIINADDAHAHAQMGMQEGAIIPYQPDRLGLGLGLQYEYNNIPIIPFPIIPFFGPIVPYVSREVFPLQVVYYILHEDDWGVDNDDGYHHGHHHHHNNHNNNHHNNNNNHHHHNVHVQHIHVPIALALHPNTILSHDRRRTGWRRRNNNNNNNNQRRPNNNNNDDDDDDDNSRRKRVKLEGGGDDDDEGDKRSKKNKMYSNPCRRNDNDNNYQVNPMDKVCYIEGILEYILGYNCNDPQDLLSASLVSRRWLEAGRNDELWKCTCEYIWGDKVGMPLVRRARGGSIGLFWRSLWKVELIRTTTTTTCTTASATTTSNSSTEINSSEESSGKHKNSPYDGTKRKMTVRDIKGLFEERPLGRKVVRDAFSACFEKSDMQRAVVDLMPDSLGGEECGMDTSHTLKRARGDGFDHLWFGSYASSIIDSKRTVMTMDELLSRKGFLMHFKVFHPRRVSRHNDDSRDTHGRTSRHRNSRHRRGTHDSGGEVEEEDEEEDVSLHFHCICYFDEAFEEGDGRDDREPPMGKFRLDDSNSRELEHPQNLTWHWLMKGKTVQVGQYPPLVVRRLDDWGWRIENRHVVLYSQ